jgi:c-di-GMP-binding flagellar brake protein YcgR
MNFPPSSWLGIRYANGRFWQHKAGHIPSAIKAGGDRMEGRPRFQDRRSSIRLELVSPVVYTQFDNKGRASAQTPSKSMDISSGGVKLKSGFVVHSGDMLEITMALGPNMVTFRGEVVHVTPAEDGSFEFGVRIDEIENQDKIALTRFVIQKCRNRGSGFKAFNN